MDRIRIGTRGSKLALWQANFIQHSLEKLHPDISFEQKIIKTQGDRDQSSSLTKIGGQGVFTKAIEQALLDHEIDMAIHSLKDLPSSMTPGLMLGAVPERGPVEDVLITPGGLFLNDLPVGAKIASGSIRRRSQILSRRPDLQLTDLRGNIETRIDKLHSTDLDGIIMARAAIVRLGLKNVKYQIFTLDEMLPAIGQGAIGVQVREGDEEIAGIAGSLNDKATNAAVAAERELLKKLDSGCQFPVGGYAIVNLNKLTIYGFVGSENGDKTIREVVESETEHAADAGNLLGEKLIKRGALSILS